MSGSDFSLRNWLDVQFLLCVGGAVVLGCLGLAMETAYHLQIIVMMVLFATVGLGWVIGAGLTGLLIVGYISFFGLGAYVNAILLVRFDVSPWFNLPLAGLAGAAAAALVAAISLRAGFKDDYFGLMTVALSQILLVVFINWGFAGRATGLFFDAVASDPARMIFASKRAYLWIALGLFLGVATASWQIMRGRFGYLLTAARGNPLAAEALGIDVRRVRAKAMAVSGAVAGMCGAFYAQFATFIDPKQAFGLGLNFEFLLVPVLGGPQSLVGPMIGAAILRPVKDLLRGYFGGHADAAYLVIYGLVLVISMLVLPRGIAGVLERLHRRFVAAGREDAT